MSSPVLVTGATGLQGGAVARALLAAGRPVRALTRNPGSPAASDLAERGAEIVSGDFGDPASLRRAAAGTSAVYAMGTPFGTDVAIETAQGIALADAATEAGTDHLVYSSVASALDGSGVPHFESKAEVERHLATLDVPWTVLAPTAFLSDLGWLGPEVRAGRYPFPLRADISLQQIVIDDLAAFAVLVLTDPDRFTRRRIELASLEVTGAEFAAALSRWTGHPVSYAETEVPPGADGDFVAMLDFFAGKGYQVDIPALHAEYPEIGWHDLEAWGRTQDWSQYRAG